MKEVFIIFFGELIIHFMIKYIWPRLFISKQKQIEKIKEAIQKLELLRKHKYNTIATFADNSQCQRLIIQKKEQLERLTNSPTAFRDWILMSCLQFLFSYSLMIYCFLFLRNTTIYDFDEHNWKSKYFGFIFYIFRVRSAVGCFGFDLMTKSTLRAFF